MNISRIQVIGQSHVKALREASEIRSLNFCETEETDIAIHWLLKERANGTKIGDVPLQTSLERAGELGPTDLLAVTILGSFHNAVGLLNHESPFTVLSENEKMSPKDIQETMIPHHVMRDIFRSQIAGPKLRRIRESTVAPIFHLATPPPKKDEDFILNRVNSYRSRSAHKSGISPSQFRLKLWQMEMEVLSESCAEFGITLLPPPPWTTDAEGYLEPVCYAPDATHANAFYGELVLRQLENLVGQELVEQRPMSQECADVG
ncbi:hypothetical protein [Roseibium sp.]|uniref:hypothetical protein n=1 Tax=Roseibium sp. TaxID=1936156 RepID=UPI003A968EDE